MTNLVKKLILLFGAVVLAGCAAPARIEQMTVFSPSIISPNSEIRETIGRVEVTGGTDTNPMWASKVSSLAFQRALEESLKTAGLLKSIDKNSKYELTADLLSLDQPPFGLDLTVSTNVRYSLIDKKSRSEIFAKIINKSYTAKFSDSFAAAQRLQLANEGAIKANILELIDELNRFKPR